MTDRMYALSEKDRATIREALLMALEKAGHMQQFLVTHYPNPEDETNFAVRYDETLRDTEDLLSRASEVLLKFKEN
jgi:hypothetical protein